MRSQDYGLPMADGNTFKAYVDRKMEEERCYECNRQRCECLINQEEDV